MNLKHGLYIAMKLKDPANLNAYATSIHIFLDTWLSFEGNILKCCANPCRQCFTTTVGWLESFKELSRSAT